ncbi:MAG TPA: hypothetical protein VMI75_31115 [Polyangiaceae bacterium]|nr:hypothetical protein [Polyangiaceae bacterium]
MTPDELRLARRRRARELEAAIRRGMLPPPQGIRCIACGKPGAIFAGPRCRTHWRRTLAKEETTHGG